MKASDQIRLKRLFASTVGGSWGSLPEEGGTTVPCVRGTDLDFGRLRVNVNSAPLRGYSTDEVNHRGAIAGDIIIEKSGGGEHQPVGRVGVCEGAQTVMPTNFAARLRPARGQHPRYLAYLLASLYFAGQTRSAIKQTTGIQNLDLETLLTTCVPRCTFRAQQSIVDHLDAETSRVDALIDGKRRMVELLTERRWSFLESLINENGPKLSLKRTASFFKDGDWIESPQIVDAGIRLIQTGNIGRGQFRDQGGRYITEQTFQALGCTEVLPGDVLISRLANTVGQACIAPNLDCRMVTSVDVVILRPRPEISAEFLVRYLSCDMHLSRARLEARGTTMQRLARSQVGELPVTIPSRPEQLEIVSKDRKLSESVSPAIEILVRQLALLIERRQTLISAALSSDFRFLGLA